MVIEGWEQAGIEVTYGDEHGDLDRYDIHFENIGGGLSVVANLAENHSSSSLFFKIRAPREMALELNSAGGKVELKRLSGEFTGSTGGGNILLEDLRGWVDLRTGGGRIVVQKPEAATSC